MEVLKRGHGGSLAVRRWCSLAQAAGLTSRTLASRLHLLALVAQHHQSAVAARRPLHSATRVRARAAQVQPLQRRAMHAVAGGRPARGGGGGGVAK